MMVNKEPAEGQLLYLFWGALLVARNLSFSWRRILRAVELESELRNVDMKHETCM